MPERAMSAAAWTNVAFGDVVRQVKDRVDPGESGLERYVAGEHMDTDNLRLSRWGDIGDGYLGPAFHMRFKPGHVLYGSRRTYLRKVAVADFEGITANTTYILEPKDPNVLLPELLPFIMQTEAFNHHSVRESKGSVNPYINFSDLAWYEFALPPIEEQRRIVALLNSAEALRTELRCLVGSAECLDRSNAAQAIAALNDSSAPALPLDDVCERVIVGIASSATHAYRESGVLLIRNMNIKNGLIDLTDQLFIDPSLDQQNVSKRVRAGDVVTARTGTPGESAVVPKALDGSQTFTTLISTPKPDLLMSAYLCLWINGPQGRAFINSRKAGGVQQNMNTAWLKEMPVRVPSIERQLEIVHHCELSAQAVSAAKQRDEKAVELSRVLRDTLMVHKRSRA